MTEYDKNRVDLLLQYILAVAGQESGWDREIGMIHLIKYAYLADLAYAKYHNGKTYTGLTWTFYRFGPWSAECYKNIEPALDMVGAKKKAIPSAKYDDKIRWYTDDYELFDKLGNKIDLGVAGTVQQLFRKFGNDTYGLLDFVYKTKPMINAAPGEVLDFTLVIPDSQAEDDMIIEELTDRKKKKMRQVMQAFKEKLNQDLEKRIELRKSESCPLPPRYDEVFYEGLEQLDKEAKIQLQEGKFLALFDDSVWKSRVRHDPEIP